MAQVIYIFKKWLTKLNIYTHTFLIYLILSRQVLILGIILWDFTTRILVHSWIGLGVLHAHRLHNKKVSWRQIQQKSIIICEKVFIFSKIIVVATGTLRWFTVIISFFIDHKFINSSSLKLEFSNNLGQSKLVFHYLSSYILPVFPKLKEKLQICHKTLQLQSNKL